MRSALVGILVAYGVLLLLVAVIDLTVESAVDYGSTEDLAPATATLTGK